MEMIFPVELKQMGGRNLGVVWNDGHNSLYKVRKLRCECKCALCVDEWSREKILKDETVPEDVRPRSITPVGRYALKFDWSDGHATGIYTFESLRALCECPTCKR